MKGKLNAHVKAVKENAVDIISQEELNTKLEKALRNKRPLKLKIGFDPTAKDIHLGHTLLLKKLRKLQDLGHLVYFIIGDFTAKIGDPSGRISSRPILSDKEIKENASTYTGQAFKILNKKRTRVVCNSMWYKGMKLSDFLSFLPSYTVARMLERDDFSQRMKEEKPLTILEFIYPLVQGYDSVKIGADIEFGGTDQKFNLIVGRHLQEFFSQEPQVIVTMPLLVGLDGKLKMSKSSNNYIGITEKPKSMFGKLMSISDEVMRDYFRLLTEHNLERVKKMHPKEAKLLLAETLVSFYHSSKSAKNEREEFIKVFSKGELPKKIPIYRAEGGCLDLTEVLFKTKLVSSKNEARRLFREGSVCILSGRDIPPVTIKDKNLKIKGKETVLKIGKKRFLKITPLKIVNPPGTNHTD